MEKNSELDQATLRLTVSACALLYIVVLVGLDPDAATRYAPIIIYIVTFIFASVFLRMAIKRWPGHFFWRRLFAMLHDYTGIAFAMVLGAKARCRSMQRCSGSPWAMACASARATWPWQRSLHCRP